jgi:hypothetical protein
MKSSGWRAKRHLTQSTRKSLSDAAALKAHTFPHGGMMKRIKAIVLSLTVVFALTGFAIGQDRDHDRDDRDHDKNHGQEGRRDAHHDGFVRGYQAGQRDGQSDRGHSRRGQNRINDTDGYSSNMGPQGQYKKGYREGYHEGYERAYRNDNDWGRNDRDHDHDGDNDRDRDWRRGQNNGGYGQNGYGQNNDVAYRTGYQDGETVGRLDKQGGHSYRPHSHDQSYGNADHNYSQVGGDKNAYKQRYRQGFDAGYARGYNGR